jgi:hypothetical protein
MAQGDKEVDVLRRRAVGSLLDAHDEVGERVSRNLGLLVESDLELERVALAKSSELELSQLLRRLRLEAEVRVEVKLGVLGAFKRPRSLGAIFEGRIGFSRVESRVAFANENVDGGNSLVRSLCPPAVVFSLEPGIEDCGRPRLGSDAAVS